MIGPDINRLQKDLDEVKRMHDVEVTFPDEDDITTFIVKTQVHCGQYRDTWFQFKFVITPNWRNSPPDVKILDKIWHPNIELVKDGDPKTGRVCVSTLGETTYRGTTRLEEIVVSLQYILIALNPSNALNVPAATEQNKDYEAFKKRVADYIDDMKSNENDEKL